jgi:hypothetical protein
MKLTAKKILAIIILIGALIMLNIFRSLGIRYKHYVSQNPALNIHCDYVAGWTINENNYPNDNFAQVQFSEPKNKTKATNAYIVITAKDASRLNLKPLNVEAAVEELLEKRNKLADSRLLSKTKRAILENEAVELTFSYKSLDRLYSVDAKFVPVKEKVVIFAKGGKFYFLRYENESGDFPRLEKAFYRCLNSLKLNP